MTRDQAIAILDNIELIKHYANGGEIGIEINGKFHSARHICLSNFRSDRPANYVLVKPKIRYEKSGEFVTVGKLIKRGEWKR